MTEHATFYSETFRQHIITHVFGGTRHYLLENAPGILGTQGEMLVELPSIGCDKASVKIAFQSDSWHVHPPEVWADAAWLQPRHAKKISERADWHRHPDGRLCWTRSDCWEKACEDISTSTLVERAAAILAKDVSFLLRCHFTADKLGIQKWPKEWDAWPHGSK